MTFKSRVDAFTLWFWFVITASFATTAHGIASFFGGHEPWHYLLGGAASLLLQLSIVVVWRGMGRALGDKAVLASLALLVIGLAPSLGSAVLASSTNVQIFNHQFLKKASDDENVLVVTRPVAELSNFTKRLSLLLDQYAAVAAQRAKEEEDSGTSCEGPPKPPECGSICRLRNGQNVDASAQAEDARALNLEANSLQVSAVGMSSQADLNALFLEANALTTSPVLAQIHAWAASEERGFSNGFPFEGKLLQCTDPEAMGMVSAIKDLAATPIDVPTAPPLVVEQGVGDSTNRNIAALGGLGALLISDPGRVGEYLGAEDVMPFVAPWFVALAIELVCAALAAREGWHHRRQFGEPAGRPLDPASRRMLQEVQTALRCLSVHDYDGGRRHTWLLIPIDADGIGFDIQNLPHILGLKQPNMRGAVTLDEITASEATRRQIREFARGAEVFTLWSFPNFDAKVADIARQLGLVGPRPRGGAVDPPAPRLKLVQ